MKLNLEWIPNAYTTGKEKKQPETVVPKKPIAPIVKSTGLYQAKKSHTKPLQTKNADAIKTSAHPHICTSANRL